MSTRTFHGNIDLDDIAAHIKAEYERDGLVVQSFGDEDGFTVQIASRQHRQSGGSTSLTVVLSPVEDGVLVKMGKQSWTGIAASLGETALSVAKNPWSLLTRLDDLAADFDVIGLEGKVWKSIEKLMLSRQASHQISERLRKLVCGYCDFANDAKAGECVNCGAPMGDEQPQACGKCGFVNDARALRCSQCEAGLGNHLGALPPVPGNSASSGGPVPVSSPAPAAPSAPPPPAKPQVKCRGCGTSHDKGTLFCSSCSRPLPRR